MRILWFDDEIDDALGSTLRNGTARHDATFFAFRVHSVDTIEEALLEVLARKPDLIVVDVRLGEGVPDGVALVQRIGALWRGPIVFLTRWPKETTHLLDPRIAVVPVEKPDHDEADLDRWFEEKFWPPLHAHFANSAESRLLESNGDPAGESYLTMSAETFQKIELDERLDLKLSAAEAILASFDDVFDEDPTVSYLVVTSWPPAVVRVGREDEPFPGKELLRSEALRDRTQIVIRRPSMVNMVNSSPCSPRVGPAAESSNHPDWFPTMRVELASSELDFHLDTGSDYTFLGYRELEGVVPRISDDEDWHVMKMTVAMAEAKALLVADWKTQLVAVDGLPGQLDSSVKVVVVRDLANSGLALACPSTCPSFPTDVEGPAWCRYRDGLIGRDVFRQTGWVLVVDPVGKKTYVLGDDSERFATLRDGRPRRGKRRR